jgi:hypothetical protein
VLDTALYDCRDVLDIALYDCRDVLDTALYDCELSLICSNIPAAPVYGVYLSQLIRHFRACGSYQDFLDIGLLLTRKLLSQVFRLVKLKSSLRKFCDHHHKLVDRYRISVSQMTTNTFNLSKTLPGPFLIDDFSPDL